VNRKKDLKMIFKELSIGKRIKIVKFETDPDYAELMGSTYMKVDPFKPDYNKPPLVKTTAFNAFTLSGIMVGMPCQFLDDDEVIVLPDL
jgi:hypothetical protein